MAKKPLNIVDEMFAGESKEARQAYDDMVAKFRIKNPDYPIPDQEAIYHKNLIHQQLAFPHLPQQKPNFGAQTKFLLDDSDICIFGGAAGGGKSHAGLLYPLMYIHLPIFGAVMLRREMPDITNVGGLLDESKKIYPLNGGMLTNRPPKWIFPSGARIDLSGLQYDSDADAFKGSQIGLVYFDEVDLFTEYQFWLLFSRARPPKEGLLSNSQHHPFNPMLRGSTNPDPDSFIRHLLDFWIGKDGYAIPERSGMKRWLVMNPDTNVREQFTIREEAMERIAKIYPTWEEWERPDPTSLSFIPSALKDNPFNDSDKDYRSKLGVLDAVKMERFLRGNWNVKYAAGKLFQPDWCEFIELADVPADVTEVRGWDIASTEPTKKNKTPDFTSGTKMARDKGGDTCYILDNVTFQLEPNDGKKRIDEIARADGKFCRQDIPLDPGSGKWTYDTLRELIPEAIPMDCSPEKGNKPDRFAPFSAHCYRGADHGDSWVDKDGITRRHVPIKKVKIVKAPWNAEFINQLKEFPDGKNDDVADSCSRAFNNLFN
nr:terminase family protein [Gammaproteobacteria bacterium]